MCSSVFVLVAGHVLLWIPWTAERAAKIVVHDRKFGMRAIKMLLAVTDAIEKETETWFADYQPEEKEESDA